LKISDPTTCWFIRLWQWRQRLKIFASTALQNSV
jgi:hypothetical protein